MALDEKLGQAGAPSGGGPASGPMGAQAAASSSGLTIDIEWDSSVSSAPAVFKTDVEYAVSYLEATFSNPVTITIAVGWGEVDGETIGANDLGESMADYATETYSALAAALRAQRAPGSSELLATPPDDGTLYVAYAEAKALGLPLYDGGGVDGYVGFSTTGPWSFTANATPSYDEYYLIGVIEHEITEDMGRVSQLDGFGSYGPIDLYRYTSPGVIDTTSGGTGSTAYFSIDGGATNLGTWNNDPSNGDLADWYPEGPAPGGNDAFNDYSNPGAVNIVSTEDITLMEALGWTTATAVTTSLVVSSGQVFTSAVAHGHSVTVLGGGETSGVVNGGYEAVSSGGFSVHDTVASGGLLVISAGGQATGDAVQAGGVLSNAGSTSGDAIAGGGSETTLVGGVSRDETIASGGYAIVSSGGEAAGVVVSGGGSIYLGSRATLSGGAVLAGGLVSGAGSGEMLEGEVVVSSGGAISGVTVAGGAELVLSSGASFAAITVASGGLVLQALAVPYGAILSIPASPATATANVDNLTVEPGGGLVITQATVASSATLVLQAGAQASNVLVSSTGTLSGPGAIVGASLDYGLVSAVELDGLLGAAVLQVEPGAIASAVTLSGAGAKLQVMSGGSALDPTLGSGGSVLVSAGALASGGVVESGAIVELLAGGQLQSVSIASGGGLVVAGPIVSSGQTLSLGPISSPETLSGASLAAGASVDAATIEVLGHGALIVGAGGLASGVVDLGLVSAKAGGLIDALTLEPGASALLAPGAELSGASIRGGEVLGSGALYSGVLTVFSGGVLSGGLLRGGGVDVFYAGATETLSIEAGGTLELVDAQVGAGSTYVAGSLPGSETLSGVTLSAGAVVELVSASVGSGGVVDVLDHGTATYLTATSSGRVAVSAGGIVGGAVIEAGAVVSGPGDIGGRIMDAGSIMGAVVFGTITVSSGGLLSGGYLRNAGTVLSGLAGATVDALEVLPGASLDLAAGATGSGLAIFDGGALSAASGASLKTVTVDLGGKAIFASRASESGLSISQGGVVSASGASLTGTLTVFAGGEIIGGVLGSGIDVDYAGAVESVSLGSGVTLDLVSAAIGGGKTITAGAVAAAETLSGVTLASGAVIELAAATVSSGGTLSTLAGAEVNGVTIIRGGLVSGSGVLAGAIADAGTIAGGQILGEVTVASGGLLSGGFLRSGASATIAAGGSAANLDVLAGASLVDDGTATWSGGATLAGALTGSGTVEDLGGALAISSGASFAGEVVIGAGVATLAGAGGIGSSQIVFSAGTSAAQLVIGAADTPTAGSTFASELLDFSSSEDSVELAGLAFVAGATAVVSGSTLVLTDGGHAYDFTLGGSVATKYVVTSDGAGTLITADPPTQSAAAQLVQAMATFGAAPDAPGELTGSGVIPSSRALMTEPTAHAPSPGRL